MFTFSTIYNHQNTHRTGNNVQVMRLCWKITENAFSIENFHFLHKCHTTFNDSEEQIKCHKIIILHNNISVQNK